MKFIICPDSFKGSLSAREASDVIAKGVKKIFPDADYKKIPLADGGEGTMETLFNNGGWKKEKCLAHDSIMRPQEAIYLISDDEKTAFIEASECLGLYQIEKECRNPMKTTSFGLGEIILDAFNKGYHNIYIGLGGTSVNDCGMGMLRALGYIFYNQEGKELEGRGEDLVNVRKIDDHKLKISSEDLKITSVCDVENPLFGKDGAAYIFATQKGASPSDIISLDNGLRNFALIAEKQFTRENFHQMKGSGAAGGIGYALCAFFNANFLKGIDFVFNSIGFDKDLEDADLVITGEGSLDRQTLMGKTLSGVLTKAKEKDIPVIGIAGKVEDRELLMNNGFSALFPIADSSLTADKNLIPSIASRNLFDTTIQILNIFNCGLSHSKN